VIEHEICFNDERYPAILREIPRPPTKIFALGDLSLLNRPQIAIVGTRQPTIKGIQKAKHFARELAALGFVITSGMAIGVDTAVHMGCLQVNGKTIAVQPCGLDKIYPLSNTRLWHEIARQGCLVSEFKHGLGLDKQNFIQRNRIISGLVLGVLVIEATMHSGMLTIAKFAMEQGREVYAVPDAIDNEKARGCHHLIKQGAKLVETIDDIIVELENKINGEKLWQNI
jgi:DNA processing protein